MNQPNLPSPETFAENRARIEREVREALLSSGMDIVPQRLVDDLVDVSVAECMELRDRIANRIVAPMIGRYDDGVPDAKLEMLVAVIEYHFEDSDGNIQIIPEIGETLVR